MQALSPGCFTRFENSENRSGHGCFTSTPNLVTSADKFWQENLFFKMFEMFKEKLDLGIDYGYTYEK